MKYRRSQNLVLKSHPWCPSGQRARRQRIIQSYLFQVHRAPLGSTAVLEGQGIAVNLVHRVAMAFLVLPGSLDPLEMYHSGFTSYPFSKALEGTKDLPQTPSNSCKHPWDPLGLGAP